MRIFRGGGDRRGGAQDGADAGAGGPPGLRARAGASPVAAGLFDAEAMRRAVAGHEVVINLATSIPPSSRMFILGAWRRTTACAPRARQTWRGRRSRRVPGG